MLLKQWINENLSKVSSADSRKRQLRDQVAFVEHVIGDLLLPVAPREGEEFLDDDAYVKVVGTYECRGLTMPVYGLVTERLRVELKCPEFLSWDVGAFTDQEMMVSSTVQRLLESPTSISLAGFSEHVNKLPTWPHGTHGTHGFVTRVKGVYELYALILDMRRYR